MQAQNTDLIRTVYPETAISWRAIFAGAVAATGISLVLMLLGAGIGLAFYGPDPNDSETVFGFTGKVIIWLIIMQWIASGLGGYIAGRLRVKWTNISDDETFFRDTASGFIAWCVATLLTAIFLATTTAATVSDGGRMALMAAHAYKNKDASEKSSRLQMTSFFDYQAGLLFRPNAPQLSENEIQTPRIDLSEAKREANTILMQTMKTSTLSESDRDYLANLISVRTGISQDEAINRVNAATQKITGMKAEIKIKAEKARKTSSAFSLLTALSMFLGAFIAAVAAVIGGRERDLLSV